MKHLVLIDGHHLMYRAYWAIPRTLKTRAGEQSNTSFGMASMLLAILAKEKPDNMVICFDEGDQTFRHEENAEYKEGRAETPDDFYVQLPRVMQLVESFGICSVSDPQYEADDFLGTYAKEAEHAGMRVTVVTGDKDAYQLASEKTRVAVPHKGYQEAEYLGPDEVLSKLGVRPDQVASYKGLCGDSSDNLKGVTGIGPKTAAALLQQFDTLESIYSNIDDVKPTVASKLKTDREQAFFCERMAELVCDIPLPFSLEQTALSNINPEPLLGFFAEMDFTLLTKRFLSFLETDFGQSHFDVEAIPADPTAVTKESNQMTLFS